MINSIRSIKKIEGHEVSHYEEEQAPQDPISNIVVNHGRDIISVKMMTKPASEGGKGCQVTVLIRMAIAMITYFNEKFPCDENRDTLLYLKMAIDMQEKRTKNRISRGVEGKDVK